MDPLSISASVVAIIQVTTDLITGSQSYYKSVKNSPKEIAELVDELESFDVVLQSLRDTSQRAEEKEEQQNDQSTRGVGPQDKASCLPTLQKMIDADGALSK